MTSERVLRLSVGVQSSMADLVVDADRVRSAPSASLRMLSHLELSLRAPEPSFALRMQNMMVEELSPQPPGFYRKLVAPFLAAFWRQRLTCMSARFHQPESASHQIEVAATLGDVQQQIRRILNIIQSALS